MSGLTSRLIMMPPQFQVKCKRSPKELTKVTVSGYSKSEVVNNFVDRMRFHDVDKANFWAAELVSSGHGNVVVSKIISFLSQDINIQNPKLPSLVRAAIRRIAAAAPDLSLAANSQEVRNAITEVVTAMTMSTKKAIKPPKIAESDFEPDNFRQKIMSRDRQLIDGLLQSQDPSQVAVPLNELATHALEQHKQSADKFSLLTRRSTKICPQYWLAWYMEMDKRANARGMQDMELTCAPRKLARYDDKFNHDCIWIAWELILCLADSVCSEESKKEVQSLLALYSFDFSKTRKTERRAMLYHALMYITHNPELALRADPYVDRARCLRAAASINFVYGSIAKEANSWEATFQKEQDSIANYVETSKAQVEQPLAMLNDREQQLLLPGAESHTSSSESPKTLTNLFAEREATYVPTDYAERQSLVPEPTLVKKTVIRKSRASREKHSRPEEQIVETVSSLQPVHKPDGCVLLPVVSTEGIGCIPLPKIRPVTAIATSEYVDIPQDNYLDMSLIE